VTENEIVTAVAARYVAFPGWVPLIRHVPAFNRVAVLPLTVHTAVVCEASVTVRPDDAEGLSTTLGLCIDCIPGFGSVIVCAAFDTVKERLIAVAAA
jgi:hypothetical protein